MDADTVMQGAEMDRISKQYRWLAARSAILRQTIDDGQICFVKVLSAAHVPAIFTKGITDRREVPEAARLPPRLPRRPDASPGERLAMRRVRRGGKRGGGEQRDVGQGRLCVRCAERGGRRGGKRGARRTAYTPVHNLTLFNALLGTRAPRANQQAQREYQSFPQKRTSEKPGPAGTRRA